MSDVAQILLAGNDGRLLNERADVLSHFWEIEAISSFDEATPALDAANLLVLCHTVTEAQRVQWIRRSRAEMATRAIVSIEFVDPANTVRRSGADAMVDHNRGPAELVCAIYELLNERGLESKHWTAGGQTLLGADGLPEVVA